MVNTFYFILFREIKIFKFNFILEEDNNFFDFSSNKEVEKCIKYDFDYESLDTLPEKEILESNENIINTIKMISNNKKNFKETNKILKEIGNFYNNKKTILTKFGNKEIDKDEEKLNNYLNEYQKIKENNSAIDNRIQKLILKGNYINKLTRINDKINKIY